MRTPLLSLIGMVLLVVIGLAAVMFIFPTWNV